MGLFILGIVVAVVGGFLWKRWVEQKALRQAAEVAPLLFAVWAAQGPFDDGAASSRAMRRAHAAVRGANSIDADMLLAFEKHRLAYDNDVQTWENLRIKSLEDAEGEEFKKHLDTAKLLSSIDGDSAKFAPRLTPLSDEEYQQREKETGLSIANAVGANILATDTPEAIDLTQFLGDLYKKECQVPPKDATELGQAWCWAIAFKQDHPDDPYALQFEALNEAWNESKGTVD